MSQTATASMQNGPRTHRLIGLVIALSCAAPLVVGAMLAPAQGGMGTHKQMGLPACGFLQVTGVPCATCGCTTAFAHATHGSLLASFVAQPFGAALALALAMVTLIAGWSAISGMSLAPLGRMLGSRRMVLSWVLLLLAAWGYKAGAVLLAAGG